MREARNWFAREFNPASFDEVMQALMGPNSGHFRMVTSYWDMAASFVLNGASTSRCSTTPTASRSASLRRWNRSWPITAPACGNPQYLSQLEQVVMRRPGAKEQIAAMREWFKTRAAADDNQQLATASLQSPWELGVDRS